MATLQAPRVFLGRYEQGPVLKLTGHVRYMAARALRSVIDRLAEPQHGETIIIDLRGLETIDSTGMGLLARVGCRSLQRGRRAVIVCGVLDVTVCLRSAAFDSIFVMTEDWPFDHEADLEEVSLDRAELQPDVMSRLMLDAHRDLASLSAENQSTFGAVVSALTAELDRKS